MPASRARHRFPRSARLRKRREFLALQASGRKVHTRHFLLLVSSEGSGRVGITVTKKIGDAVTRNRVKRLVREFVRTAGWVPPGRDVVVVARRSAASLPFAELASDLMKHRERVATC